MIRGVRRLLLAVAVVGTAVAGIGPVSAAPPHPSPPPPVFAPIGRYTTGLAVGGATAAEIVAVRGDRIYVSNADDISIDIVSIANPAAPTLVKRVSLATYGSSVTSVAVANDVLAVAVVASVKTNPGTLVFLDAKNDSGAVIGQATVGALPDMVTFTKNGKFAVVANEGEPSGYGTPPVTNPPTVYADPVGSVSVVDVHQHTKKNAKPKAKDNVTIGFEAFNVGGPRHAELPVGVRIYGPGASVAQDLEPEYITVLDDNKTAFVTLQENNAIAQLDLNRGRVDAIWALGLKDHSVAGNGLDASDRDGPGNNPLINIANWPVYGLYEPDAIASVKIKGRTYLLTANEGDTRADWPGYQEEARVGDAGYTTDAALRQGTNADIETNNDKLSRLTVSIASGNTDGDAEFEQIHVPGARSFSIWSEDGQQVFDSGDQFEQIVAAANPSFFNSNNDDDNFDNRSDNKGPEPEAITVGTIGRRVYAVIGLERQGGIVIYDITDPSAPAFVQYANARVFDTNAATPLGPDSGPERVAFVEAHDSPNGRPLLVVSNEVTGTVAIYSTVD